MTYQYLIDNLKQHGTNKARENAGLIARSVTVTNVVNPALTLVLTLYHEGMNSQ